MASETAARKVTQVRNECMMDECGVALEMSELFMLVLTGLGAPAYFICDRCRPRYVDRPQSHTSTLQRCRTPDGLAGSQQIDVDATDTHYLLNCMCLARIQHRVRDNGGLCLRARGHVLSALVYIRWKTVAVRSSINDS